MYCVIGNDILDINENKFLEIFRTSKCFDYGKIE